MDVPPTPEPTVQLLPSDTPDEPQTYPVAVVKQSITLANMLEDFGDHLDVPIPIVNVTASVLAKVMAYCAHHLEEANSKLAEQKKDGDTDNYEEGVPPTRFVRTGWDKTFLDVPQPELFELILAANYLDVKPLLNAACKTVADLIRGKTTQEMRAILHVENDFTPEEEEKIRKENEWIGGL